MKQVFKIAPLALAVAAFSTTAMAEGSQGGGKHKHQKEGVKISKTISVEKDVVYKGGAAVLGLIKVDSLGMAVVDQKQETDGNLSINDRVDNDALVDDSALSNARGNLGVNVSAGDNNVQSNAAALAAADASFAFGSADAEVFVDQKSDDNVTYFIGTINDARMSGDALSNARGNIGVNVAAGAANAQANSFAGAVASGSMGESTVSVKQSTTDNMTHNLPEETYEVITTEFRVGGTLNGGYVGGGSGSYDTVGSTLDGTAVQTSAVYPEIWIDDGSHGNNDPAQNVGHLDFDTENPTGGVFEFDVDGDITPDSRRGGLRFTEAGWQSLGGTLTGSAQHVVSRYVRHHNNASMDDNVLKGARGNIGVNITAGSGNLQNNSLALSRINDLTTPE